MRTPQLQRQGHAQNLHDLGAIAEANRRTNNKYSIAFTVVALYHCIPPIITGVSILVKAQSTISGLSKIWSLMFHQPESETQKPCLENPKLTATLEALLSQSSKIEKMFEETLIKIKGVDILQEKLLPALEVLPEVYHHLEQINTFLKENKISNQSAKINSTLSQPTPLTSHTKGSETLENTKQVIPRYDAVCHFSSRGAPSRQQSTRGSTDLMLSPVLYSPEGTPKSPPQTKKITAAQYESATDANAEIKGEFSNIFYKAPLGLSAVGYSTDLILPPAPCRLKEMPKSPSQTKKFTDVQYKNTTNANAETKGGFSNVFYKALLGLSALGFRLLKDDTDKKDVISDQRNIPIDNKNKKNKK